jgi:DNA polymerase III delta subunit
MDIRKLILRILGYAPPPEQAMAILRGMRNAGEITNQDIADFLSEHGSINIFGKRKHFRIVVDEDKNDIDLIWTD